MATTMGVKIDKRMRQRLKVAAQSIDRTPHWLMKNAIVDWLKKVEAGADIRDLTGVEPDPNNSSSLTDKEVSPTATLRR